MANLVRERMGIEYAQAVGGWKTRELVEHVYSPFDQGCVKKYWLRLKKGKKKAPDNRGLI